MRLPDLLCREVLERTCLLNVRQRRVQVLQFRVDLVRRLLRFRDLRNTTHSAASANATSFPSRPRNQMPKRPLTAFASNASMAFTCAPTSYVAGLNSRMIFSASSTIALFFSTLR